MSKVYVIQQTGLLLSDAMRRQGISFAMPCGGMRTCGKCAVWVRGQLSPASAAEAEALSRLAQAPAPQPGFQLRLACFAQVLGPCAVIPADEGIIVESDTLPGCTPVYDGAAGLGIAVDIGTTTVAMQLYDLPGGERLAACGEENRQAAYGADVLSRIAHADQHGMAQVSGAIQGQLAEMAQRLLTQAGRQAEAASRVVITGNTTMLHFAAGLNPHSIGQAPFTPESLFGQTLSIKGLSTLLPRAEIYLPRCVSAYVGADITCGMLAADTASREGRGLLVDVGTNGEIVLWTGQDLLCCATAAGPAFEGAGIHMGMQAVPGAICRVYAVDGAIHYDTIGGAPAKGLCGSGLLGAVRVMLETGALDRDGGMEGEAFAIGGSGVCVTQQDVRALQLAKAAIAAGIDTLLHTAGIATEQVDQVLLAGGFGSRLDARDAAAIGLIPMALAHKTVSMGNLALSGAVQMLFSRQKREECAGLATRAKEIPLSTHPYFFDRYIERIAFPNDAPGRGAES